MFGYHTVTIEVSKGLASDLLNAEVRKQWLFNNDVAFTRAQTDPVM